MDLPLSAVFEHPTVARLAELIDSRGAEAREAVPPLTRVPRDGPLPDTLYVFENYPMDASVGARTRSLGLRRIHSLEQPFTALDAVVIPGRELTLQLSFVPERFEPGVIEALPVHWHAVLESLVANPHQRLAALPQGSDGAGTQRGSASIRGRPSSSS